MPPSSVLTASPWDSSTALKARSHGWFLISALTAHVIPLLTTMVRPLNAANPATTSWMSALSHVTVMRGACDCAASLACAARYSSIDSASVLALGEATRAAWPPRLGAAGAVAGSGVVPLGGALATVWLVHAAKAVRSAPIFTRI